MNVEQIARLCHEMNRKWCRLNEDYSLKPWDEETDAQQQSMIKGVQLRLDNPGATAESQHNAWLASKVADGWIYGPTKDAELKTHPCLVPYEGLPASQRVKDAIFTAIVDAIKDPNV